MKNCIILFLLTALLLCGCSREAAAPEDTVSFYFPRADILYGSQDGVIAPELREASISGNSLEQRLYIYLSGPKESHLVSPFPAGTALIDVLQDEDRLTVILSDEFFALEGFDLTVACASLTQTCFSLTDAQEMTICSADNERTITMTRESFIFYDDSDSIEMTIGTESAK